MSGYTVYGAGFFGHRLETLPEVAELLEVNAEEHATFTVYERTGQAKVYGLDNMAGACCAPGGWVLSGGRLADELRAVMADG